MELFHAPDGETAYAVVPVREHRETWPVRSRGFKGWLAHRFYAKHGKPPNAQALTDALGVLEARARFDGPAVEVAVRVAGFDGAIYLDLANEAWDAVEVTPTGWRIVRDPPVRFRRPKGLLPLPTPVRGGRVMDLQPFLNLGSEADWTLTVAWLLAALRPTGPYPVLVLHGEQGTGKSTNARVLRSLIDPNSAPLRGDPIDSRDVVIAANNGWLLVYDNLSHLPGWLSDVLSRLATGGGFATRELYSDADEVLFQSQRPTLLNGIDELVTRGDLLDRSLLLYLPKLSPTGRSSERAFWAAFEAVRPRLFGALLTVVGTALADLPAVRLADPPRLADFAEWVTAAERGLTWTPGAFTRVYAQNRAASADLALDASPVVPPLRELLDVHPEWSGIATELLSQLSERVSDATRRQRSWPTSPQGLSNILRRLAPSLRAVGIELDFDRREAGTGRRLVSARKTGENIVTSVTPVTRAIRRGVARDDGRDDPRVCDEAPAWVTAGDDGV